MKIVFFTTGMTRGGAERVIATLSNRLVELGHEVAIVMLKGEQSDYPLDERVGLLSAKLNPGVVNAPAALRFYRRSILEIDPDVVVAFTVKPNLMACAAKKFFGVKAPLVVSERANPFQRSLKLQGACNALFAFADEIVCQSRVIGCYYEGRVSGVPVEVIPNPLDESCVADHVPNDREMFLLSVGRLCKQKRHDISIKVLAQLTADYPNLRLKICGEGPDLEELKRLADALGVAERVEFCGNVPNVMKANANATAYLMPSDYEGFPNALIEAVASGIPVISVDFSPGLARELVQDGQNGYVVAAGDVDAVTEAVKRMLRCPAAVEELERSSEIARRRFSLDSVADQWMRACEQALGKTVNR